MYNTVGVLVADKMNHSMPSGSRKVISFSLLEDVELKKTDHAWKRTSGTKKETATTADATTAVSFIVLNFIVYIE